MSDERRIREHLPRVCASIFGDDVEMDDLSRITTGWETDIYAFTLRHGPTLERSEPMLRRYEHAAGLAVEQLGYFEVAAACRRFFDVLVSLHSGAGALGMRPGAEALMRQQGGHLRRVYMLL